jgi:predicted transcriptional regulator
MIHRGEIIEQAVRESGMSITKLAIRMGRSRRHIYNLFETVDVPLEVILEIGKIINHDFTYLLPASSVSYSEKISLSAQGVESTVVNSSEIDYWKNKYLDLLEKYNKILESRI